MDYRQFASDSELKQEFLDRFDDLKGYLPETGAPPGAFESFDAGVSVDDAVSAFDSMQEGTWQPRAGLEAIIERFARPVYMVQRSTFGPPPDDFQDSDQIDKRLQKARAVVEPAIPSVGRIDLRNHPMPWAGTGWMVAPGVVATNRHVAEVFARQQGDGFAYRKNLHGREPRATLDWRHEYEQPDESRFRVNEILWIEPDESFDVALLGIVDEGEEGEAQPAAVDLLSEDELGADVGRWIGVIGYPAQSPYNDLEDQQRIFDGIYDVKRLAPGQITSLTDNGLLEHDATTLGGNSGSAVIDLDSGKVAGIHFGGIEGKENYAVQAPRLAAIVRDHAG